MKFVNLNNIQYQLKNGLIVSPPDFPGHNAIRHMRIINDCPPYDGYVTLDWRLDRTLSGEPFPFGLLGDDEKSGSKDNNVVKIIV